MSFEVVKPEKIDRWLFSIIFILLGALIAGSIFMIYQGEYRDYQTMMALEGQLNLESQERLVILRFADTAADTLFLTNLDGLRIAGESGDYSGVESDFRSFAEVKTNFDQMRFINKKGMEIVRVNSRDGIVSNVPSKELQDKSGRYYVREAQEISRGEIYVSPLDLNIEQGVIETPIIPMMRFASPVFTGEDRAGLIVINYRASVMLEELKSFGIRNHGIFLLLNRDGYYLSSPEEDDEWGFMFPEGDEKRYSLNEPDRWKQISSNETFQYESPDGIISSRIIRPLAGLGGGNRDYYWIAVNILPKAQLVANSRTLMLRLFLLGAFLFLLSAIPAWGISKFVIRRRRMKREQYYFANYDDLTSLPNRHLFNDRLEQALSQARRFNHKGALLFLDLDGFKAVNDKYGHDAGDEILRFVGNRLKAGIRESDSIGRIGGDEFVILVPVEQDINGLKILSSKLIEIISRPYRLTGIDVLIGVSIGIRVFPENSESIGDTAKNIIKDADTAMYQAKSKGKGRYSF